MGVLDRFERSVERVVNGAFARAFKSEVQPVELASALRRETDTTAAVVGPDRTLVPNAFTVELGPSDHDRICTWQDDLAEELAASVTDHARSQRYSFPGPVSVRFVRDEELATGVFRVRSARVRGAIAPATAAVATPARPVLDVDGHRYQVTGDRTVLGRGSDCDVVLDDPGVSRRHAEVVLDGARAAIHDLGSTNGTVVDGVRLDGPSTRTAPLRDGSTVLLGRTRVTFLSGADRAAARDDGEW
ncbi:DUF3662 and FHA domain-containing protein [Quadrisphaera sp. DSM 44207]|uniref:FhaA domain-containing protein n=1 Tax=Quadrisphaera sp. DSM 44207 TaxID=1881057 RepID=UPI0008879A50|nr:DUF3662 and FHA domain-containing protein [Quadrisphaera sp. DSM 44207]SDQ22646.1 FHA domain-containing protein [Quadrisphaera sp. DSM 44207]